MRKRKVPPPSEQVNAGPKLLGFAEVCNTLNIGETLARNLIAQNRLTVTCSPKTPPV